MNPTPFARFGQAISGGTLLAIAVTAGGTGLYINVHHGLDVSTQAGILFGLADLTKIVLPIVAGIIGWKLQTRLVAVVCVIVSIWCASNAYLSGASQNIAGKQHGADQYASAQGVVTEAKARVEALDAKATAEAANGGCGKICKSYQDAADKARQTLTQARTALEHAKPVAVDQNAQYKALVTAGMFLFLIEALVWLSVPAMSALRLAMAPISKPAKSARKAKRSNAKKPIRKADKIDWTQPSAYGVVKRTKSGKTDMRTKAGRKLKEAAYS